ncbi:MAG: AMP-binding protein [Blastocatellia bacterium]|nr:AMP-binding protein [Blastocatellia bacterium]MCX7752959.1 AMP-binding protein [Blastocatellia bacterium]MDW8168482.1 AMP-binding protein [Acidobacteriota bacterium]MDW8256896.1 AMP-binding protein [Acidobacteriota bacterium]
MLDLERYQSLGEALRDALERWADYTCLIEADRERENCRLTYRQFKERALPLVSALQQHGFAPDERAAIIMTNQSKWLISAYAIFYAGGVLVPLDYKLSPREQIELLRHARASVLITEFPFWRSLRQEVGWRELPLRLVLVTEAPPEADLEDSRRWEEFRGDGDPQFIPRRRQDVACIVYSSGTGGRPKGCVLTHENYLEQCRSLTAIYPFSPEVRYLSILPTNHAIDFMVGFIGPFVCGATVVHLRTLRPEYIREAFVRYKITHMTVVPMILKNLERGLRERFASLPWPKRALLQALMRLNRWLTRRQPNVRLSRRLFPAVHRAFGGHLEMLIVGGAFTEPSTLQFFYDLGIPVANGYGLTEACTAVTVNDLKPFRADTVGKPLPGVEVKILDPDAEGIGEVAVRGKNVMSHYLDDPELTAETIVDGWLLTGDLGRIDETGHLQLVGRKKNMIVTEGGKNIYPEDVETFFEGLPVKEFCIFAANYLWPERRLGQEQLILVIHPSPGEELTEAVCQQIRERNRRLPEYKRVHGYLVWDRDFPRTASLKIKRTVLAEEIRQHRSRADVREL